MFQKSLKTILLTAYSMCFFLGVNAQKSRSAEDLYYRRNFTSALEVALTDIKKDSTDVNAYLIVGSSYMQMTKNDSAIVYLEKVNTFDKIAKRKKMYALLRLGYCYAQTGNYSREKEVLDQCVQFKKPRNLVRYAQQQLVCSGLDDQEFSKWKTRETNHFTFYFDNIDSIKNVEAFIQSHENAFDSINLFFNTTLPRKIAFYVWRGNARARELTGYNLGFAYPQACIIHASPGNSIGHEMTHCITYYAAKPIERNKLISEGVCVYFDLTGRDGISKLKTLTQSITSVADVWRNSNKVDNTIVYPLGGELVKRLIETFGKEKFMQLLADQTYESAQKIYGAELDVLLKKLDKDLLASK